MSFRVRRIREFLARALRPTRKKVVIAVLAVVVLGALILERSDARFRAAGRQRGLTDNHSFQRQPFGKASPSRERWKATAWLM